MHRLFRKLYLSIFCITFASIIGCTTQSEKTSRSAPEITQQTANYSTKLSAAQTIELEQALVQLKANEFAKAKTSLSQIDTRSKNPSIETNLALAEYQLGEYTSASQRLSLLANSSYADSQIFNLHGLVLLEIGEIIDAEKAFANAIELNKDNYLAYFNLALVNDIYFQNINKAYQHYRKYLALIPFEDQKTTAWVEELSYSLQ